MYTCPVCGYNELPELPEDWLICPSCHTEFGYSDENWGVDALRQAWIQMGAKWRSNVIPAPAYWSPIEQLRNIRYEVSDEDKIAIARASDDVVIVPVTFEMEDQAPVITQRPVLLFGNQPDIIIRLGARQQPQSSDNSNITWQPQPA